MTTGTFPQHSHHFKSPKIHLIRTFANQNQQTITGSIDLGGAQYNTDSNTSIRTINYTYNRADIRLQFQFQSLSVRLGHKGYK